MRLRPVLVALTLTVALAAGAVVADSLEIPAGRPPTAPATLAPSPASPAPSLASPAGPSAAPVSPIPTPSPSPGIDVPSDEPFGAVRPASPVVLQARLDRFRARNGIPGISATILWPDGTEWTGTSGFADVATRTEVTPDTAFAIASISKTFTAALILQLAQEGAFRIDDPVARYLPDLGLDRRITIRQLLDHTSGVHDYFFDPRVDGLLLSQPARTWTAARALRFVGKPYFPPGRGWHYSNTNYLLLGLLAERVTGRPVAEELRTRFLAPLGLTETWYQAEESPRSDDLAHGYRLVGRGRNARPVDLSDGTGVVPFTSVVTAAGAAGSIASTSLDVARWARALYGGDVLDPASLASMIDDAIGVAYWRPTMPYGLGVQELTIAGWGTYGHSGRLLGFRGAMRYLPDTGVAIAVLTNQSSVDPAPLVGTLLDAAFPAPLPCRTCR